VIIIGIHGKKRSGKSTVTRYLVEQYGFGEVSFAAPMKRALATMLAIDIQDLERDDLKEAVLPWLGRSPRYLMQTLGTQWGRELVNDRIWITLAERAMYRHRRLGMAGVVFSDVRFDNEAEAVLGWGGQVWTITRPTMAAAADNHASERGISTNLPSRGIVNCKGFPDLYKRVDALMDELGACG
jgi:hypothetical protein